jgi:hypothetical protein
MAGRDTFHWVRKNLSGNGLGDEFNWNRENLRTEGVIEVHDSNYRFVHICHPLIDVLRHNADAIHADISRHPRVAKTWVRVTNSVVDACCSAIEVHIDEHGDALPEPSPPDPESDSELQFQMDPPAEPRPALCCRCWPAQSKKSTPSAP